MHYQHLQRGFILRLLFVVFLGIFLFTWAVRAFVLPPIDFPAKTTFVIKQGESLGAVAYRLETERLIKSPEAFKLVMLILGSEKDVSVGEYYFDAPATSLEVAFKISGKDFGIVQNKITFPEGYTNTEMSVRLSSLFPGFDASTFLTLAKGDLGYLFPDTYSFSPSVTPPVVIAELKKNFIDKITPLETEFSSSKHSKGDIIVMASIIEKEANDGEESNIVAGILWKRISLGIPLQVDAPFLFLFNKTSAELTVKDLAVDSPYNTYKHKGLPPTPINNPGLAAIEAALHPTDSPYLYYLHDAEGTIHYARTHDEHVANKNKYLK